MRLRGKGGEGHAICDTTFKILEPSENLGKYITRTIAKQFAKYSH